VVDDLSEAQLGEYDIAPPRRRSANLVLLDRSIPGLVGAIEDALARVEPMASYLPRPVLNLLVESTAQRRIAPDFPRPTVIFVNLVGLPESVDHASPGEVDALVLGFAHAFALINAAVEARGGVLKKVTYHPSGSDIVIYFGVLNAHTNDPIRAADTALSIREIITRITPPTVGGKRVRVMCQVGVSCGAAFAAEIGEPRGRREFNVLGDTVNTAARLMGRAGENRIFITDAVYREIAPHFDCEALGALPLKGKETLVPIFDLRRRGESRDA
jgi:class 3 adenylate cyclase